MCLLNILDNSEIGEDGFFVEGIFENYYLDVSYEDTNFAMDDLVSILKN